MEFIKIETVLNETRSFSFEIESNGLYTINCLTRTPIQSLDKIYQICIMDGMFIITTDDRNFRNGALFAPREKEERRENNINAYDHQGNHLWNIGEIVGDIKMTFDGFCYVSHETIEQEFGVKLSKKCGRLISCIADSCFMYIIDVANKKILLRESGKY